MTARTAPDQCRRILVVEDDEDVRFVCSEALRYRGFVVTECPTLTAAWAALDVGRPDAVLLDRELPDGSGLDLARWLRGHSMYDDLTIIAFSGRTVRYEIEEAFAAGCDAFVAKPCTSSVLVGQIEAVLAVTSRRGRVAVQRPPAESEVRAMGSASRRPARVGSTG